MIFGHHFDFQNESVLRKEYSTYSNINTLHNKNNIISVTESLTIDEFPLKTDWIELSGQNGRYHTYFPYEESKGIFSWALEIQSVITLVWDSEKQKIIYVKGKSYTARQLQFWIFHTFFPIVLELEHIYRILHVGSVEVENKPILFSARSFGGKSTMIDYFIQKGHTLLSDDSLGIDRQGDKYYTIPSYPFHRPYRKPETLGYSVQNFAIKPKPLHAVYLLEKSEPNAKVEISEVKGIDKFKAFHYSTFVDFSFMKQERFEFFMEMSKHVPVYRVTVPWDMERLDKVYDTIVEHSTNID